MARKQNSNALIVTRLVISRKTAQTRSRKMGTTKYDIEKFLGENDFGIWRIKMQAILIQHGCAEALK